MTREERRATGYGIAVTAGFVVFDIAITKSAPISGSFALGAIVAGVLGGFRPAVLVGMLAIPLSAASGLWNDDFGSSGYWARLFVAACGTLLALGAGRLNERLAAQLARQELLAAVADLPEPGATLRSTAERVVELLVPRYATYASLEAGLATQEVQLVARGTQPLEGLQVLHTRLRARGRDLGTLTTTGGRTGADDPAFLRVLAGRIALALDNAGLSTELVTVEQQLQAILENLGEAVTVQDRTGRLVFANSAAADLLGAASVDELLATPPTDLVDRFVSVTEAGAPIQAADLPGRAVLEGRTPQPLTVRVTNRQTGEERWRITKSTAVRSGDGEVLLAVNVIEDITETKRAAVAQRLLADASAALASSLDYTQTLQQVADLAVPELADRCSIQLVRGDAFDLVALAERDALAADTAIDPASVLAAGAPKVVAGEGELDSELAVPMATAGGAVGVLSLLTTGSGRRLGAADLDLAVELGRRCAAAVERSRIYAELESVATTLQRGLLPPALPDAPGWSFQSLYLPAGGEADVGGDFYDVFKTGAGWMAVMGDVVGRGPAAASLTAMARYTLRTAGALVGTPTMGLARLNENLRERGDMALCTVAVVLLRDDSDEASLVCAGHPLPLLVRDGDVQPVGRTGPLLGAFEHGHWLPAQIELAPGDVLVLYTDGVLDARSGSTRFGEERLRQTLQGVTSGGEAVDRVRSALLEFAGAEQDDDTAVLAIQKL